MGKVPDFAMEVASPTTASNDLGHKRDLYESLGIYEYWRLDPTGGDLYGSSLVGERLVDGRYLPYELDLEPDGAVRGHSELLDVDFYWDGQEFDVLDPLTGKTTDKRAAAEEREEAEREARLVERREAEARERALLDEIARLRRQIEQR